MKAHWKWIPFEPLVFHCSACPSRRRDSFNRKPGRQAFFLPERRERALFLPSQSRRHLLIVSNRFISSKEGRKDPQFSTGVEQNQSR